ncbi:MAG TPA: site-2 protease family protein [Solirubrobacteraceae bacterium]|jgi:regulator of sigma E protease|nr:site-2 protease family protein [Solirubrobacteraceae bacterium]
MSFVLAFLGFALLIILHEAGHFVVAKAVGMRVERFSLFFPPLIWKTKRGETEYGIGAIPLGGYVKITGMNPEEEIPPEAVHRAYYNQAVWKRVVTILAGPFVNLLIAFFLILGIALSEGQPVVRDGHAQFSHRLASVGPPAAASLRPGDTIVAIDGRRGLSVSQISKVTGSDRCAGTPTNGCRAAKPVTLLISRAGHERTVSLYPRYVASAKAMRLGISFPPLTEDVAVPRAASATVSTMWRVTSQTVSTIGRIFESKERKQLHGVVGSYTVTEESFSTSTTQALWVLALISLSLAVINLFPFLPLDGGHVFWAVAEKVRGRRIPFAVMERAGLVGFALIAVVFVIGLSNDISTLSGPGFGVR